MLPTSTLALILFTVMLAACRLWMRRTWRRTQEVTAEPAWHEQWLGQRRNAVADPEDMNPSKVLTPLVLRAMPNNRRSSPPWHEQWLTGTGSRRSDEDDDWTLIEPLAKDEPPRTTASPSR